MCLLAVRNYFHSSLIYAEILTDKLFFFVQLWIHLVKQSRHYFGHFYEIISHFLSFNTLCLKSLTPAGANKSKIALLIMFTLN